MSEEVNEEDTLSHNLEEKFMSVLESLVSGKIKNIGQAESEALIALRKEFIRRNLTIQGLIKEADFLDKNCVKYFNETQVLSKTVAD